MNRGLIYKSIRELWSTTLLIGLLVGVFEGLIAGVIPRYESMFNLNMQRMPFVKQIIEGMLGTEMAEQVGPEVLRSIPWAHPVMLSLILAHAVICATRLPAGEVDRGTIDITLGLPISRRQWMFTDSLIWLISAMAVIGLLVLGNRVGSSIGGSDHHLGINESLILYLNLLGVYLVVGGWTWLISSFSDRRGRALTLSFVLIVTAFLLSYLQQFWAPAGAVSWLSVLTYHQPVHVLRGGGWPVGDLCVLYGSAVVLWSVAARHFTRRDLCTT